MEEKTSLTVNERKQRALATLNSAFRHLEKVQDGLMRDHPDAFKGLLSALVELRWQINQIDKASKHHENTT